MANDILTTCKKCIHFYITVTREGKGYNPAPYCHKYEDTGERANVLTQNCLVKRKKKEVKN